MKTTNLLLVLDLMEMAAAIAEAEAEPVEEASLFSENILV